MEQLTLPVLIALTSVGTYFVGARVAGLSAQSLRPAVGKMLECGGLTLAFLGINLVVGVTAALAARHLFSIFVSVYPMADAALLGFSLLQAITLHWWRELSKLPRS